MTAPAWTDELGGLTGEQLHELGSMLTECRELALLASLASDLASGLAAKQLSLHAELAELHHDVSIQQARITVPMRQAQGIIWRALFARNHPVPVSGH